MNDRPRHRASRRTIVLALLALSLAVELVAFRMFTRPKRIPLEVLGLQIVNDAGDIQGSGRASDTTILGSPVPSSKLSTSTAITVD